MVNLTPNLKPFIIKSMQIKAVAESYLCKSSRTLPWHYACHCHAVKKVEKVFGSTRVVVDTKQMCFDLFRNDCTGTIAVFNFGELFCCKALLWYA